MPATEPRDMVAEIARLSEGMPRVRVMEVCGTHTVSLFRSGVRSMVADTVRLISGPGCPVCVTAQGYIDAAVALAARDDVTVCTYGDMVRVPGGRGSLETERAAGGTVQVVYSARDAVRHAMDHPDRQVVFLGVGFETTAPATAAAILDARRRGLGNFTVLCGHKLIIPAMELLLSAGDVAIDGFLCPGHVSVVIGEGAYQPLVERFGKPCVIAGFEPQSMLRGLATIVRQVGERRAAVANEYGVAVRPEGNAPARACIDEVFGPVDVEWRAMGTIRASGLGLRPKFAEFDAARRFGVSTDGDVHPEGCRCGEVIQGKVEPAECVLFGTACTPMQPIGPCMVSSEGTCAAWFKYGDAPRQAASQGSR